MYTWPGHLICPHCIKENRQLRKEARVGMWLDSLYFFTGSSSITELERKIWGNRGYASGNSRVKKLDKYKKRNPAKPSARRINEVGRLIPNSIQVFNSPLWSALDIEKTEDTLLDEFRSVSEGTLKPDGSVIGSRKEQLFNVIELSWSATQLKEFAICVLAFQLACRGKGIKRLDKRKLLAVNICAALSANLIFQYQDFVTSYPSFNKIVFLIIDMMQVTCSGWYPDATFLLNDYRDLERPIRNIERLKKEILSRYPRKHLTSRFRQCIIFLNEYDLMYFLYNKKVGDLSVLLDAFEKSGFDKGTDVRAYL